MLISLEIVVLIYWFYSAGLHILFIETAVGFRSLARSSDTIFKGDYPRTNFHVSFNFTE